MSRPTRLRLPANSARRALAILGDRWILLILRDAFLGVRQFSEWQARLGITPTVLSKRLKRLVEAGLFRRVGFSEMPPRVDYRLTERGLDIYGFALMLLRWEQRWFAGVNEPRIVLRHRPCGEVTEPRFTCGSCRGEVTAREVRYEAGPGAGAEAVSEERVRRATITAADRRATHRFLEHVIDILGDRWTSEVVAAAFFGHRRFDALRSHTGMATNILSDRLRRLTADGVLQRREYRQRPARHEYMLTDKGRDLYPETVMLMRWGDRWLSGKRGLPLLLFHKTCGLPLDAQVTCSACGAALAARDVSYEFVGGASGTTESKAG
jgi:DNA-binding HxlR family transcriptional regulator